nr:hypothetical protein [Pandoravirus massiliensis]
MDLVQFGETTPLGVHSRQPKPPAPCRTDRAGSFATRLGRLMAANDQRIVAGCFWSVARLHSHRWHRPLCNGFASTKLQHHTRYTTGDCIENISSCVSPMVRLLRATDRHTTLAGTWRDAMCRNDRDDPLPSWRADVAALLDCIDHDVHASSALFSAIDGIMLFDGPTTAVAEIIWSCRPPHKGAIACVDLVQLCHEIEHGLHRPLTHHETGAAVVLLLGFVLFLLLAVAFGMVALCTPDKEP